MGIVFSGRGNDRHGVFRTRGEYWDRLAIDAGYSVNDKVEWPSQILVSSRTDTKKATSARNLGATVMSYPEFERHCAARRSDMRSDEDTPRRIHTPEPPRRPYTIQKSRSADGGWEEVTTAKSREDARSFMRQLAFTNENRGCGFRIWYAGSLGVGEVIASLEPHEDEFMIYYRDSREDEPFGPYKEGYTTRNAAMARYNELCENPALDWADLRIVHWSDRDRADDPVVATLPTRVADHTVPPTDAISAESAKRAIQWED